jgi:hypothetical protein
MDGVDVYSTAKSEYTEQFCIFLVPALQQYFLGLVDEAKEKEKDTRKTLWMFQNLLKDIPDWNQDKVLRETEKITQSTKCDYLEELLTAVFIAHTKVLSAIRLTNREKKKIQITVPKLEHFLHRTLSESARILWSNAYLFSEQGTSIERQKNLRQVEMLLHQAVLQSIRSMLPVKNILREYLNSDGDAEEESTTTSAKAEEEDEEEEKEEAKEEPEKEKEPEQETPIQIDISGTPMTEEQKPEVAPTPAPPSTPEPVAEPVIEKQEETTTRETEPAPAPPTQQVFVFDTEPSVKFSEHDTIFDSENPNGNQITSKAYYDEEEEEGIEILDTPPEAFNDFEDLEQKPSSQLATDDFETLE